MSNATTLATLNKLIKGLNAAPAAIARGAARATVEIRELVTDEFKTGSNPWGRAWAPAKDPRNPLLDATGALIDSTKVEFVGGEIKTTVGVKYGRYLQRGRRVFKKGAASAIAEREMGRGAKRHALLKNKDLSRVGMKPRTIIPFKALPPTWGVAIATAIAEEVERTVAT